MVSFLFLIFGLIDVLGGVGIILSGELIIPQIARYVGVALLLKGIWTIITSFGSW